MNLVLDLFTKREITIMLAVVGLLVTLVIIVTVIDFFMRKKKNDIEESELSELEEKMIIDNHFKLEKETNFDSLEENKVENIVIEEEKIEEEKPVIKETNVEYIEPLIMDFEEDQVSDLKEKAKIELLKVEENLESPKSLEDTISSLEAIEENDAIISYQELLEKTSEIKVVENDNGDEPISIKEILSMYDNLEEDSIGSFEMENFKEIQLENTANLEKLDKEIRKTNEFLNILNELKKNLD